MFELPETAITDVFTNITGVIGETWIFAAAAIGITLAFVVLGKVKGLFVGRKS